MIGGCSYGARMMSGCGTALCPSADWAIRGSGTVAAGSGIAVAAGEMFKKDRYGNSFVPFLMGLGDGIGIDAGTSTTKAAGARCGALFLLAVDVHLAGGAAISFAWCVQKLLTLAVVDMQIGGAVPSTLVPCHWGAGVSDTVNNIDKFIVAAVSAALGSPFASPATVPIG